MSNNMMTNSLLFANDTNEPRRVPRSCAECVHVRNCRVKNCKVLRAGERKREAEGKSARSSDNARQSLTRDSFKLSLSVVIVSATTASASTFFSAMIALCSAFFADSASVTAFCLIGSGATERRSARSCACSETDAVSWTTWLIA